MSPLSSRSIAWLRPALFLFSALFADSATAAEPTRAFSIPAGPAEISIKTFSEQSGRSVMFAADKVKDVRTNAVKGDLPPAAALDQLLAGTGLTAVQELETGGYAIKREGAPGPNAPRAALAKSS